MCVCLGGAADIRFEAEGYIVLPGMPAGLRCHVCPSGCGTMRKPLYTELGRNTVLIASRLHQRRITALQLQPQRSVDQSYGESYGEFVRATV